MQIKCQTIRNKKNMYRVNLLMLINVFKKQRNQCANVKYIFLQYT